MSSAHDVRRPSTTVSLLAAAIGGALAMLGPPAVAQETPGPGQQAGEAPAATELDTVVVTGLRSSLQSAQSIKQNSEQIVDSIVAEDIGKLPDITASASLARVTGVQVTRAACPTWPPPITGASCSPRKTAPWRCRTFQPAAWPRWTCTSPVPPSWWSRASPG